MLRIALIVALVLAGCSDDGSDVDLAPDARPTVGPDAASTTADAPAGVDGDVPPPPDGDPTPSLDAPPAASAIDTTLIATAAALQRANVVIVPNTNQYSYQSADDDITFDARGKTIDAGALTLSSDEALAYVVKLGGSTAADQGRRWVWVGGKIRTGQSRSFTWDQMKSSLDGAGILFRSDGDWFVVDGAVIVNVMDGLRPRFASRWVVRNCYLEYIRDDAVENDHTGFPGGLIWDSLIDGAFMAMSHQGAYTWNGIADHEIHHSLIRLEPMPYRYALSGSEPAYNSEYGNDSPRHGHIYKSVANTPPTVMSDTIIYVEQHSVDGLANGNMTFPAGTYSNVTLIWKGYQPSAYPVTVPPGVTVMSLLTHSAAELDAYWDLAVARWKSRHGFVTVDNFDPNQMIAPAAF